MMRFSSLSVNGVLLAALLEPTGGLMSELTGDSAIHFRLTQKRKNARSVVRRLPLARAPSFQLAQNRSMSRRRELVDHDVAAAVGVRGDLFRESAVLAQGRGRQAGRFAVRDEHLAGVRDGDARLRRRRLRRDGSDASAGRSRSPPSRTRRRSRAPRPSRPCPSPCGRTSVERARRDGSGTGTAPPALAPLVAFAGARILGLARFAFEPVPAVETEFIRAHVRASLACIARYCTLETPQSLVSY